MAAVDRFLGERCNCIASSAIVIRCRLSIIMTRVYCDKTTANRITLFHWKAAKGLNC